MIDQVVIGARVSMTPKEADALCGAGPARLVRCPDGRIIAGVGSVGFSEFTGDIALADIMASVKTQRELLAEKASETEPENPRNNLYTFVRI